MVDEQLSHILVTLGELKSDVKSLSGEITSVKKSVQGNGQPGIKQEVEKLQQQQATARGGVLTAIFLGGSALGLKVLEFAMSIFKGHS